MESANLVTILILAASWLNLMLYTAELFLIRQYFLRPRRPVLHQVGVGALAFFDSICTLAVLANACIVNTTMRPKFGPPVGPLATMIFTTYLSAGVAQLFFCNLFFRLTGNTFVLAFLVLLIAVHCGFSFASAILLTSSTLPGHFAFTATTVGAISCAATDICIAACLSFKFWRMLSSTGPTTSTRSLVWRILVLTVSSGMIVASNTLTMMIILLRGSIVFNFFFACQGRVYSLMLLGNFLLGIPGPRPGTESTSATNRRDTLGGVVFHVDTYRRSSSPTSTPPTSNPLKTLPGQARSTRLPQESQHLEEHRLESLKSHPMVL